MGQNIQKWDKILELFYEYPNKTFTIRELAKKTKIPHSTVQRYINEMKKQKLITKENTANITNYFQFKKTFHIIDKMFKKGLIEHLQKKLNPSCIILFGSARKGDYVKESDIDLFVESCIKKNINLEEYEKKLNHNIQLFNETSIKNLPKELFNNVINGIKLSGYLKIK